MAEGLECLAYPMSEDLGVAGQRLRGLTRSLVGRI